MINAPVDAVWPWLVQVGQGRGGLYSFDGQENLGRCNIHSLDRIVQEHQRLSPLWHLVEPIGFVVEREMLRGIRRRAERPTPGTGSTV